MEVHLTAEQAQARRRLDREMAGRRYLAMIAELRSWQEAPPLTTRGDRAAGKIKTYLQAAQHTFDKRLLASRRDAADEELVHRARKAGKRARYIAELAEPVLGKSARRYVARATTLQDLLGTHQDSVAARDVLRALGATSGSRAGENGFTYGLLYAHEQHRAETSWRRARKALRHP